MILAQSDRERGVGGEDELCVSLPPVPAVILSTKKSRIASGVDHLMQAMFTGAETVAWYTMVGNKRRTSCHDAFLAEVLVYMFHPCSP